MGVCVCMHAHVQAVCVLCIFMLVVMSTCNI